MCILVTDGILSSGEVEKEIMARIRTKVFDMNKKRKMVRRIYETRGHIGDALPHPTPCL